MNIKIKTMTKWERWRVSTFYDKEPETIAWVNGFEGGAFWDIGANIGVFSLWCAYRHPGMVVHAFEPMRDNFFRLWENICLNGHAGIMAHFMAVGAAGGRDAVFTVPRAEVGASGGQIDCRLAGAVEEYRVPVWTGEALAWVLGQPSYVKIDTDGNEPDVLRGMGPVLSSRTLKSVLVEVNNSEKEVYDLMDSAGLAPDDRYNSLKNRKSDYNIIFSRR